MKKGSRKEKILGIAVIVLALIIIL
jgi:hypothetical protein